TFGLIPIVLEYSFACFASWFMLLLTLPCSADIAANSFNNLPVLMIDTSPCIFLIKFLIISLLEMPTIVLNSVKNFASSSLSVKVFRWLLLSLSFFMINIFTDIRPHYGWPKWNKKITGVNKQKALLL